MPGAVGGAPKTISPVIASAARKIASDSIETLQCGHRANPTQAMKRLIRGLALFLLLPVLARAQDDWTSVRAEFTVALARAEAGETGVADTKTLSGYVLYPYVLAARLQQEIKSAPNDTTNARVQKFLTDYATWPIARELRKSWLQSLAQRQDWPAFKAAYSGDVADDDLRCQSLLARIKTGEGAALRDDALKLWLTGQKMPQTCTPAFDWMRQQGWLTADLAEKRARLALAAGNTDLAEFMAQSVAPERAAPLLRWVRLIRAPQDELGVLIADPKAPVEAEALLDGYSRLARSKPDQALQIYKPLLNSQQLKGDSAGPYTAALALGLAWARMPEAVEYFKRVPEAAADTRVQEWRVRAALWNGQWPQARDWIARLPKTLAVQDRWTYWRARGLEQAKATRAQALSLYRGLSAQNNIFGVLAAWRMGLSHRPTPQPQVPDGAAQSVLQASEGVIRARELRLAGRESWAIAEWRKALEDATPALRVQAGLLASNWGWYSQAIPTLATAAAYDDFSLTYPLAFEPQVKKAQALSGLPPAWIYGVMRQESLYDPAAVSARDAYGLMQLLLPTAQAVAKRWKQPAPTRDDLFQPDINLQLGAAYLRELRDKSGGSLLLALGAYNAGPNAVARWLPDKPVDADIWMENIPYAETRSYVQRILWHITVFGWKETGQPQDLSGLLVPVSKAAQ
jgi:soluble lytic murein transglycosylase